MNNCKLLVFFLCCSACCLALPVTGWSAEDESSMGLGIGTAAAWHNPALVMRCDQPNFGLEAQGAVGLIAGGRLWAVLPVGALNGGIEGYFRSYLGTGEISQLPWSGGGAVVLAGKVGKVLSLGGRVAWCNFSAAGTTSGLWHSSVGATYGSGPCTLLASVALASGGQGQALQWYGPGWQGAVCWYSPEVPGRNGFMGLAVTVGCEGEGALVARPALALAAHAGLDGSRTSLTLRGSVALDAVSPPVVAFSCGVGIARSGGLCGSWASRSWLGASLLESVSVGYAPER